MVPLCSGGPRVSRVVAGCWRMAGWNLDLQARVRWIEQCLELGVSTFDHADIYGDYAVEELFGQAVRASPSLRGRVQVVTKCGIRLVSPARPFHRIKSYDTSRSHLIASVEASLEALGVERIDLLLLHRPDALVEPEELADTLRTLIAAGKVEHFGVSNHTPAQLALLRRRHPVVTNQIEFSALQMKALADGTLEQCVDLGMRPMAWSPLAGGRLLEGTDEQALRVRAALAEVGQRHGVSPATAAYAWILRHPSRPVPVAGTHRIEALREAVAALDVRLSAEDWYAVWQASIGHPVP